MKTDLKGVGLKTEQPVVILHKYMHNTQEKSFRNYSEKIVSLKI